MTRSHSRPLSSALVAGALALGLGSVLLARSDAGEKVTLVVIVNKARPETDLSSTALGRLYRGESKFWDNEDRVVLFLPPSSLDEALRSRSLSTIAKLNVAEFVRYWQERVFRGENRVAPLTPRDANAAAQAVFGSRSAIAILEAGAVPNLEQVARVLTIDGKTPGSPSYPLSY